LLGPDSTSLRLFAHLRDGVLKVGINLVTLAKDLTANVMSYRIRYARKSFVAAEPTQLQSQFLPCALG
jgi:hypothetical protein